MRCVRRTRCGRHPAPQSRAISGGYEFANTQHTQTMEERDPFRAGTFDEYHKNPEFATPAREARARRA